MHRARQFGVVRPRHQDTAGPRSSDTVRVVRNTFVPVWSVPPKVLLVDDDDVCCGLANRLLKVGAGMRS